MKIIKIVACVSMHSFLGAKWFPVKTGTDKNGNDKTGKTLIRPHTDDRGV